VDRDHADEPSALLSRVDGELEIQRTPLRRPSSRRLAPMSGVPKRVVFSLVPRTSGRVSHETVFAATMTDRADWEHATRQQRQLAVAADTELRRRHPDQPWLPLRSAEPEVTPSAQPGDPARTPETDLEQAAQQISDLAVRHREFSDQLAQRQSMEIPAEDPDYANHGPAFPAWRGPYPDAILQPPRPEIQPSPWILERAADRGTCLEANDDLAAYAGAFDQLRAFALSPAQSALLLRGLAGD
jgi:hypothetical protein